MEDRPQKLTLSAAFQPGQPDNFPSVGHQVDIAEKTLAQPMNFDDGSRPHDFRGQRFGSFQQSPPQKFNQLCVRDAATLAAPSD